MACGLARYRLRPGTPQNGPGILAVHRRAILALGRAAYTDAEVESWAAGLVAGGYGRAMTERDERFMVAVDGSDTVIGFCSTKADEVVALFIDPDWVRGGLGSDLLRRVERTIVERGHDRIRVFASLTGRSFYEGHGYGVVRHKTWKTRGGLELAALNMEKRVGGGRGPETDSA